MKKIMVFAVLGSAFYSLYGCGSSASATSDDKAIRAGFAKKTFDINDVPANERDRVKGFMQSAKNMAAKVKGKAPTKGP